MLYSVIACEPDGSKATILAECRYVADAEAVLRNWHIGYIASDGAIVRTKNTDFGVG